MMKSAEGMGGHLPLLVYTGDRAISKAAFVPVSVNSGTEKEPEPRRASPLKHRNGWKRWSAPVVTR
jgi:hypothetical protein